MLHMQANNRSFISAVYWASSDVSVNWRGWINGINSGRVLNIEQKEKNVIEFLTWHAWPICLAHSTCVINKPRNPTNNKNIGCKTRRCCSTDGMLSGWMDACMHAWNSQSINWFINPLIDGLMDGWYFAVQAVLKGVTYLKNVMFVEWFKKYVYKYK